jgi:hypothetical protein
MAFALRIIIITVIIIIIIIIIIPKTANRKILSTTTTNSINNFNQLMFTQIFVKLNSLNNTTTSRN